MEDPVVLLERNLYGHPSAGLLWERQFEQALIRTWMGKNSDLGMRVRSSKTRGYFCELMWMTSKWLERSRIVAPMWKRWMKNVDIDEPASFLDHVHLGCTQRECKQNEAIIDQYTQMFESRLSAVATEKLLGWQKPHAQTTASSYDMEGHAQKKCVGQ